MCARVFRSGEGRKSGRERRRWQWNGNRVTANLYNLLRACSVEWQLQRAQVEDVINSRFVIIVYWTPQSCELDTQTWTQKFDLTISYSLVRPEQTFDQFLSPPRQSISPSLSIASPIIPVHSCTPDR